MKEKLERLAKFLNSEYSRGINPRYSYDVLGGYEVDYNLDSNMFFEVIRYDNNFKHDARGKQSIIKYYFASTDIERNYIYFLENIVTDHIIEMTKDDKTRSS